MGVTGLWPILEPSARPTELATLNRRRLAVDASIWIYQFLKAVRDKEGNALRNSHVVGFFRRICKLLYFGIKPVFVFDGGAPALKRQTIQGRKSRREGRRDDASRTALRLVAVQKLRMDEEAKEKRMRDKERKSRGLAVEDTGEEPLPDMSEIVYQGEVGMSAAERQSTRKFHKKDAYHLPDIPNLSQMGQPNDPRIMSAAELEEYARQFNNGEDINLYDFSKIDFDGEFFRSLPMGDQYNILNAARLRSRLRLGLSKEQLEHMFPNRMDFSKFQIERVMERNELTQRLMNLSKMSGDLVGVGARIAAEHGREYVLVKNDGVEGGWALGVVSTEKGVGERNKPIDVDALHEQVQEQESETEDEFEDVPVEGLNRLPKADRYNLTDKDLQTREKADQRRQLYLSRDRDTAKNGESSRARIVSEEPTSLFVDDPMEADYLILADDDNEDLNRAIADSLNTESAGQKYQIDGETDEEEHLARAIALSLQKQHNEGSQSEDEIEDFEDVPMPSYKQRAVEAPKPLTKSSGSMIAHIVNNRANAAIPKRRAQSISSGSDSDMDLQSALAKARREKAPEKSKPAPVAQNLKNPFDGPLPFEKLDFKSSIFSKKGKEPVGNDAEVEDGENGEDGLAGGFNEGAEEEDSKPLPPWLVGNSDIRSGVEEQRRRDIELNAEDRERALEEEMVLRKENEPIEIESGDDSDVEIVNPPTRESVIVEIGDAPSPQIGTENMGDVAEVFKADPPVSEIPNDRQPSVEHASEIEEPNRDQESEEELVEWSESDYGDNTKSTTAVDEEHPAVGRKNATPSNLASPEFEDVIIQQRRSVSVLFENVEIPEQNQTPPIQFEDVNMPDSTAEYPSKPAGLPNDDTFDQLQEEAVDEFDFSDPDDEELLAQLATEAEEHARFASTLNNKSAQENKATYEAELKALRNQQKKDRRDADEVSHIMIEECQALLRLFGLPYITAPMEAEAQCAALVHSGLVDGIVTDDSDIFLFGGTRVYKNMFNSNKFVECYLASDLEKELSLSRDKLIAIAHLLGSDYTEGLPGVGPVTAVEILAEFPDLKEFKDWFIASQVSSVPEVNTFRKKFKRAHATKLFMPPAFPSEAVTDAYLNPEVDNTREDFQWGVPDLDKLRDFLMATIGWSSERTDEVLVPVIRDMNQREAEGTQSNITRYFQGAVGTGVSTDKGGRAPGSKRMKEAVGRLKARKSGGMGETMAERAKIWAGKNDLSFTEKEKAKLAKKKAKKRKSMEPEANDIPVSETVDAEMGDSEADDESGSGEYAEAASKKPKSKGKGAAQAKKRKTKV
jgi:DNA excision repair protein ERCC-5